MKFELVTVNESHTSDQVNHQFDSMDEMLAYVKLCGHDWTSLLVIILPSKEAAND